MKPFLKIASVLLVVAVLSGALNVSAAEMLGDSEGSGEPVSDSASVTPDAPEPDPAPEPEPDPVPDPLPDPDPVPDPPATPDVSLETETDDKNIIVNVTLPAATPAPDLDVPALDEDPVLDSSGSSGLSSLDIPVELAPTYPAYSVFALDDTPPVEDETAISTVVTALFGTYTPRTQTVTEHLADGSSVTYQQYVPGVAGMDWPWMAGVGIFSLMLFCLFKMIGGLLRHG